MDINIFCNSLNSIFNNGMVSLQQKIEHCLEKYPETRNSDIKLTNAVWIEFHNSKLFKIENTFAVKIIDLYELPSQDDVKRIRAKIQNNLHKFLPTSEEVRKQRKIKEIWWHREMSTNNPSMG